jgi:hypothetical protein
VARERPIDSLAFTRQAVFIDAGTTAGPARTAAAEQGRGDGGRSRGIADTHFTEAEKIACRRDRVVTFTHGRKKFLLRESRHLREIARGPIQRERHDAQVCARGLRQLIDGRAADGEVCHHLRRYLGRIGRDAVPGDAVIAGKDKNFHLLQPRRYAALPMREPADEFFKTAQAARRLGQRRFAPRHCGTRRRMPARQIETGRAKRGK